MPGPEVAAPEVVLPLAAPLVAPAPVPPLADAVPLESLLAGDDIVLLSAAERDPGALQAASAATAASEISHLFIRTPVESKSC